MRTNQNLDQLESRWWDRVCLVLALPVPRISCSSLTLAFMKLLACFAALGYSLQSTASYRASTAVLCICDIGGCLNATHTHWRRVYVVRGCRCRCLENTCMH